MPKGEGKHDKNQVYFTSTKKEESVPLKILQIILRKLHRGRECNRFSRTDGTGCSTEASLVALRA